MSAAVLHVNFYLRLSIAYWDLTQMAETLQTPFSSTFWCILVTKALEVITYPCRNFNGDLAKPVLYLEHGWEIKSHINLWMWLVINVHILVNVWQWNGLAGDIRCVTTHAGALQKQPMDMLHFMSQFICSAHHSHDRLLDMMTSSSGNIIRVTGHLRREFIGHRWIPLTKASDAELWCFLWSGPEWTVE